MALFVDCAFFSFFTFILYILSCYVKGQILTSPIIRHDGTSPGPKSFNSTADYVEYFGYTVEHHNVISEDGFLISVYRIPGEGMPIIVQHGLMLASDCWVIQGPRYDLAFMLADSGRDVWLPDSRGNYYSRSHLKLSHKNTKFWNFSFHETALYDLPAVINYILQLTKRSQLDYIGHSVGGLTPIVMCAIRPEMNSRLRSVVTLAPAVFFNTSYNTNVENMLSTFLPYMRYLNRKFSVHEFFPRSEAGFKFLRLICSNKHSSLYTICLRFVKIILGVSIERPHDKPWLEYAIVSPTGVSYKNFVHLEQFMRTGRLAHFDYGPKINYRLYGSKYAPDYDLSLVTVPVVLIYGDGDTYIHSEDVDLLSKKLPNVIANYRIDRNRIDFNHGDFIWGNEAKSFVYDFIFRVLSHLDRQTSNNSPDKLNYITSNNSPDKVNYITLNNSPDKLNYITPNAEYPSNLLPVY